MRSVLRLLLLTVAAAVALLALAGPAAAHATVVSSSPADGTNLAAAPALVSITFNEAVGLRPGYLRVIDDNGRRVDVGVAHHPGTDLTTISVPVRADHSGPAGYLASYRVVSADSHPISGVVRFTVAGGRPVDPAARTPVSSRTVAIALDVATALLYAGLALAGGGWVLVSRRAGVLDSAPGRRIVQGGLVLAAVAALAQIGLQGPYTAGVGLASITDRSLLADTLSTSYGHWRRITAAALIVLIGLAGVVGRWQDTLDRARQLAVVGCVALWGLCLVSVAAPGHAGVQPPVWLGLPSTVVHLAAMATWVGGLVVLLAVVIPAESRAAAGTGASMLVRRFSRVAVVCVAVLAVTGTYQAWLTTRSFDALVTTTYGQLVIAKTALFAGLVALGALARRHVRRGDHATSLRRGVGVELVLLAAVLTVTSVLVTEPPAQQARAEVLATRPATVTAHFDPSRSAAVRIAPAHAGPVELTVTLSGVATVLSLTLTASLPSQQIGPVPATLVASSDTPDTFVARGVDLPVAGRWQLQLTLRTSRFDSVVTGVSVVIT